MLSFIRHRFFGQKTRLAAVAAAPVSSAPHRCIGGGGGMGVVARVDHAALLINTMRQRFPAFVLSKSRCLSCIRAKKLLSDLGVRYQDVKLDALSSDEKMALEAHIKASTGAGSVPRVYVGGVCFGGFNQVQRKHWAGELLPALVAAGAAREGAGGSKHSFDAGNPQL
mmetsp:Transcript_14939/g.40989  ORF Transcript_14939/g.40989 Transcript_14939/m.40989 type:complete len:168 (-) Transcript_14939:244-747(-)